MKPLNPVWLALAGIPLLLACLALFMLWPDTRSQAAVEAEVRIPALEGPALAGATLFSRFCAECHGLKADGTDQGPPLIHKIYMPNHHGDAAFYNAALNGVRGHHWPFGNMPPVEGITRDQVTKIIAFIRTVQKENGIF
jgi:mono/diheme cytochrome c family protein